MLCHETELQCAIANALADFNRLQKRFFFIAVAKMHEEMKSWMVAWNRWLDSLISMRMYANYLILDWPYNAACHFLSVGCRVLGRPPCVFHCHELKNCKRNHTDFLWFTLVSRRSRFSFNKIGNLDTRSTGMSIFWRAQKMAESHKYMYSIYTHTNTQWLPQPPGANSTNPIYLVESVCLEIMTLLLLCETHIYQNSIILASHFAYEINMCVCVAVAFAGNFKIRTRFQCSKRNQREFSRLFL